MGIIKLFLGLSILNPAPLPWTTRTLKKLLTSAPLPRASTKNNLFSSKPIVSACINALLTSSPFGQHYIRCSGGEIRTRNLALNRRLLCHWATPECQRHILPRLKSGDRINQCRFSLGLTITDPITIGRFLASSGYWACFWFGHLSGKAGLCGVLQETTS